MCPLQSGRRAVGVHCAASGVHGQTPAGEYAKLVKDLADMLPSAGLTALSDTAKAQITKFTDCRACYIPVAAVAHAFDFPACCHAVTGKKIGPDDDFISDACGDVCWNDDSDGEGKKAIASLTAALANVDTTAAAAKLVKDATLIPITVCDQPLNIQSSYKWYANCVGNSSIASKKTCACYGGESGSEAANFNNFNKAWYTPSGMVNLDPVLRSCNAFMAWSSCVDRAPGGSSRPDGKRCGR